MVKTKKQLPAADPSASSSLLSFRVPKLLKYKWKIRKLRQASSKQKLMTATPSGTASHPLPHQNMNSCRGIVDLLQGCIFTHKHTACTNPKPGESGSGRRTLMDCLHCSFLLCVPFSIHRPVAASLSLFELPGHKRACIYAFLLKQ